MICARGPPPVAVHEGVLELQEPLPLHLAASCDESESPGDWSDDPRAPVMSPLWAGSPPAEPWSTPRRQRAGGATSSGQVGRSIAAAIASLASTSWVAVAGSTGPRAGPE